MSAVAIIRAAPTAPCLPWPRHVLSAAAWQAMAAALCDTPDLDLLALWGDAQAVHGLFQQVSAQTPILASMAVAAGSYPALSPSRPAAAWFERMIRDLWGHTAIGGRDPRPWLDHGAWGLATPLAARPAPRQGAPGHYEFLAVPGEDLHQTPIGPLAPGIMPAGQLRATGQGEAVAALEARLGYLHRGIQGLLHGKSPRAGARFAARLAGDATVAHSIAFARAAEAASDATAPPRAAALRVVMAEAERIASHLADAAALCLAADAPLPAGLLQQHREAMLRAAATAFGHRLMMDAVIPGGVASDISADGQAALGGAAATVARALPALAQLIAVRLDACLAGLGVVPPPLAHALAAGGPVGRASGRPRDARLLADASYADLNVAIAVRTTGDAAARFAVRWDEIRESCRLLRTALADLPPGALVVSLPLVSAEGLGWAEGARGDIWHWLRLEGGQITASFLRDPAWLQLPLLEAAMQRTALTELHLVSQSFGLSYAGMDI